MLAIWKVAEGGLLLAKYEQGCGPSPNPVWSLPSSCRQKRELLEDCWSPFTGYLAEGVLPQMHEERYKLRKLATCYFLHEGILFKKWYDGDLLQCLGPKEASEIFKEVHAGEYREH